MCTCIVAHSHIFWFCAWIIPSNNERNIAVLHLKYCWGLRHLILLFEVNDEILLQKLYGYRFILLFSRLQEVLGRTLLFYLWKGGLYWLVPCAVERPWASLILYIFRSRQGGEGDHLNILLKERPRASYIIDYSERRGTRAKTWQPPTYRVIKYVVMKHLRVLWLLVSITLICSFLYVCTRFKHQFYRIGMKNTRV